jgi:hypothetical protein
MSNLQQAENKVESGTCAMCGAITGDVWETQPTRPCKLRKSVRPGDTTQIWIVCDECGEGMRSLSRQAAREEYENPCR